MSKKKTVKVKPETLKVTTSEESLDLLGDGATKNEAIPEAANTPTIVESKTVKSISGMDVKVATRPWESTHNNWESDVFRLKQKRNGWRPRFVPKENISRKRDEGWQVANCADYGIHEEEGQIDSTVTRKGMVLMEMPEEMALDREAYFRKKTDLQTAQPDTMLKQQLGKTQKQLGGSVNIEDLTKSSSRR